MLKQTRVNHVDKGLKLFIQKLNEEIESNLDHLIFCVRIILTDSKQMQTNMIKSLQLANDR